MFDSVLARPQKSGSYVVGGVAAVVFHAAIIVAAVIMGAQVKEAVEQDPEITFFTAPPPPPPPPPPAAAAVTVAEKPKPRPKPKREAVQVARDSTPTPIEPKPQSEPEASPAETAAAAAEGGQPGGVEGGVAGGVIGGLVGGTAPKSYGGEVVALTEEMDPPQRLSGADPKFTAEAISAGANGLVLARCVVTREGRLEKCNILKGVPHMNEAVLSALGTHRYKPAMLHGSPVSVHYVLRFRLVAPIR